MTGTPRKTPGPSYGTGSSAPVPTVENETFSTVVPMTVMDSLEATVQALRGARLADSSRTAYRRDVACWQTFQSRQSKPALPVLGADVAAYIAELLTVGSPAASHPTPLAPSTIERRMAALGTWCREQGLPRPDLAEAREVLHGHQRLHGQHVPAQAAPLTVQGLREMLDVVDADADGHPHRALRNRALLLVAFAVGARRSEVVSLTIGDIAITSEGALVTMLRKKTRTRPDRIAVPYAQEARLCPVKALVALRSSLAELGLMDGPLFRRITATDRVLDYGLKPAAVAQVIHGLAQTAQLPVPDGFKSFSGHSARRGMATESRRAGSDPLAIARQGGWKDGSQSLNLYLADVDRWSHHPLKGVL